MTSQPGKPLAVGDVFHGFARGAFGRDHYDCVKIEAVGPDWIVSRDVDGDLTFAAGVRDLRLLMKVRDEEPCPEEKEGGTCPLDKLVQLTERGGFFCESE